MFRGMGGTLQCAVAAASTGSIVARANSAPLVAACDGGGKQPLACGRIVRHVFAVARRDAVLFFGAALRYAPYRTCLCLSCMWRKEKEKGKKIISQERKINTDGMYAFCAVCIAIFLYAAVLRGFFFFFLST